MQEWIIAMLVISIMLILRDMAKTFFRDKRISDELAVSLCESHPKKEKIERYAIAYQKLADAFYGMPYRKEYFSKGQIFQILESVNENVCNQCYQKELCWQDCGNTMFSLSERMIRAMEDGNDEELSQLKKEWGSVCNKHTHYMICLSEEFQKEKHNLFWNNQIIENRFAVAQQLTEVSRMLSTIASDLYDISEGDSQFQYEIKRRLKKKNIIVKDIWVMDKAECRRQVIMNLKSKTGKCISVWDISQVLSELCNCSMTAGTGSRNIVSNEFRQIHFIEDVVYQIAYGTAKLTNEDETVSGDSYLCRQNEEGKFIMCLSDGMGSGMEAHRESEIVVDLLEQFFDAGFSQETAAHMVNSVMVQSGREGMFSTLDLCTVDLYTGVCNFLKAGASSTFIKRNHWVEVISSESIAAGLVHQIDFDKISKKLYHGDYVIMMSDGVLDALPVNREEETMKEIIGAIQECTPKDISREILERALGYSDYRARDDMTVLVAGMWKK